MKYIITKTRPIRSVPAIYPGDLWEVERETGKRYYVVNTKGRRWDSGLSGNASSGYYVEKDEVLVGPDHASPELYAHMVSVAAPLLDAVKAMRGRHVAELRAMEQRQAEEFDALIDAHVVALEIGPDLDENPNA